MRRSRRAGTIRSTRAPRAACGKISKEAREGVQARRQLLDDARGKKKLAIGEALLQAAFVADVERKLDVAVQAARLAEHEARGRQDYAAVFASLQQLRPRSPRSSTKAASWSWIPTRSCATTGSRCSTGSSTPYMQVADFRLLEAPMTFAKAFGGGAAEGRAKDKALLGGKGANLAEMASLGLPVPPGFTITTEVCRTSCSMARHVSRRARRRISAALAKVEQLAEHEVRRREQPLLVCVRSGARASMPGMMDTILNLGLDDQTVPALAKQSGSAVRVGLLPPVRRDVRRSRARRGRASGRCRAAVPSRARSDQGEAQGAHRDQDLVGSRAPRDRGVFKSSSRDHRQGVSDDVSAQLWGAIGAVFALVEQPARRRLSQDEQHPASMGTAVNVQAMVFGNLGDDCATGVAFTRNPATATRTCTANI